MRLKFCRNWKEVPDTNNELKKIVDLVNLVSKLQIGLILSENMAAFQNISTQSFYVVLLLIWIM